MTKPFGGRRGLIRITARAGRGVPPRASAGRLQMAPRVFWTNWRMTEMQAAIGRVQLRKLDAWVDQRRRNAAQLRDGFRSLSAIRIPEPPTYIHHAYYRFYTFVRPEALRSGWSRD